MSEANDGLEDAVVFQRAQNCACRAKPREVVGSEATDCSADAVCPPVDAAALRGREVGEV